MIVPVQKSVRLFESIYEQMISLILRGEWEEGQRLPGEETLSKQFGVSRNSLRTAIKVLHASEILESKPGLGTFVCDDALRKIRDSQLASRIQGDHDYDDILDARFILEKETAYLAAKRRTPEDLEELERIHDEYELAVERREVEKYVVLGSQFHLQIVRMAHNPPLTSMYESLQCGINEEKTTYMNTTEYFHEVYEMYLNRHHALIQALKDQDGELARTLMEEHTGNIIKGNE